MRGKESKKLLMRMNFSLEFEESTRIVIDFLRCFLCNRLNIQLGEHDLGQANREAQGMVAKHLFQIC